MRSRHLCVFQLKNTTFLSISIGQIRSWLYHSELNSKISFGKKHLFSVFYIKRYQTHFNNEFGNKVQYYDPFLWYFLSLGALIGIFWRILVFSSTKSCLERLKYIRTIIVTTYGLFQPKYFRMNIFRLVHCVWL